MARRKVEDEHVNHERWLVSYADFITLLFAFFVVMYSISQVNEGKYKVLSETLTEAFTTKPLSKGESAPERTLNPFQVGDIAKSNPLSVIKLKEPIVKQNEGDRKATQEGVPNEHGGLPSQFEQLSNRIEKAFGDLLDSDMITLRGNEEWLEIGLKSSLLFDSGDARLSNRALKLLGDIGNLLKGKQNAVRVEGFTDNVPIHSAQFPSNWELSTARAAAVVELFIEEGLDPARFAVAGYGENQPIADNTTDEGRAKNRRVVLMISRGGELRPSLRRIPEVVDKLLTPAPEPNAATIPDDQGAAQATAPAAESPQAGAGQQTGSEPAGAPQQGGKGDLQGVKTVELEGGGLLFTSEGAKGKEDKAAGQQGK